ncbi:hypothetical protein ABZ799_28895 [Nocardiopsis dassonvillei]|uniref:hypothetical protein n=1 Tax=Nocardiopsis dassonvillei TaxID=2014 RepID=UPI0033BFF835
MSLIDRVTAATGATRAEVLRVAREGGVTEADRAIAEAIEAAGGRRADDLMHHGLKVALYGPAERPEQRALLEQVAGPLAGDMVDATGDIADPDPAPSAPRPDEAPQESEREVQAAAVHADLAEVLDNNKVAARLTKKWASRISAVHQGAKKEAQRLLLSHDNPRIRRRAAHRARWARRTALAA